MKNKSYLLFLLFAFLLFGAKAQRPDSVQLNGEWRYVYPVEEKIIFKYNYYSYFDLTEDEYYMWLEWKMKNDPRAELKTKELKPAIHLERIARKEIAESEYYTSKRFNFKRRFGRVVYRIVHPFRRRYHAAKINMDKTPELAFGTVRAEFPIVPPVVRNLPDGKYVQYFAPRMSIDKRKKSTVIDSVVACVFELHNDNLNGYYVRKEWSGDTLCEGNLKEGFQDGSWFITKEKSYNASWKRHEVYEDWTTEKRSYVSGLQSGETRQYDNGDLVKITEFKNGSVMGITTELNYEDSTVFDRRLVLDPDFYKLSDFNLDVCYDIIERAEYFGKYNLKESSSYRRWSNDLVDEISRYSSSGLLPSAPDSLFESVQPHERTKYNPTFNSFYHVYDRKTKELIFSREIDTVANKIVGWSKRPNGPLLDTLFYDYDAGNLIHICYDDAGKVFWENGDYVIDSSKLKTEQAVMIDGFETVYMKRYGYKLGESIERNDTLYARMYWNKKKELDQLDYVIESTDEIGSIIYDGTATYSSVYLNGIQTFDYTDRDLEIVLTLNTETNERDRKITLAGKEFNGVLEFSHGKKKVITVLDKGNKIAVTVFRNSIFEYETPDENFSTNDADPVNISDYLMTSLLNVSNLESGIKRVSGKVQNNVFTGDVRIEIPKMESFTLNYSNGLPSGKGTSRGHNLYTPYFHKDSLGNDLFKTKSSSLIYTSTYTLKNGQLDGEVKLFTVKNEQFASINYRDGKLNGPIWIYSDDKKLSATYKEDILVGNLLTSDYEPIIQLLQTDDGELIEGTYQFSPSLSSINFEFIEEKWVTKKMGEGLYETNQFADNVLYETRIQNNDFLLQTKFYLNGFLSYTKEYADSAVRISNKILALRNLMNEPEADKSALKQYGYVDVNLTPWEFEANPLMEVNFAQTYYSTSHPHYLKKYNPTGLVSREGYFYMDNREYLATPVKQGLWKYYDYEGRKIRDINYQDTLVSIDKRTFDVKGSVTDYDSLGKIISTRFLLEETEHYECSNDDYYSERQYITVTCTNPNQKNGLVKNYYENGALMNEGQLVNGIPNGLWKFYTPDGKLGRLGSYEMGQKNGKWLTGDLSDKAYIGDVCIDPNSADHEVLIHNLEEDKEIKVDIYKMGVLLNGKVYSEIKTQSSGISF
jgi:antitoxin component YwqK of YwqJK toxin-antitoxin module